MRSADYVEMTTTSIAGTSGDGAVTCTAITSIPTFTLALGSGATQVRYVIEDTVNKKFETGIGSVASNVLTRSTPQITWDGTTWTDNAPSALQFGSTPTTGNIKIRLAATAEAMGVVLAGVNTSLGSDAWRDYPISAGVGFDNNGTGGGLTADREYYTAYELANSGKLNGIQFEVTTGVAGNMKLALYSVGANGLPGQKIVDFTTTSVTAAAIKTDTATGSWTPATPIRLPAGWYYIGFISDVACSIRYMSASGAAGQHTRTPLGRESGYEWACTCFKAGSYATGLPANPAPTTLVGANSTLSMPWIGLKVVA